MIKRKETMQQDVRENVRGGKGKLLFHNVFDEGQVANSRVFAVVTAQPGDSLGVHTHVNEGEVYLILDGELTVTEDGVDYILKAGDAEYCADGHSHGFVNHGDQPASLLAVIIQK